MTGTISTILLFWNATNVILACNKTTLGDLTICQAIKPPTTNPSAKIDLGLCVCCGFNYRRTVTRWHVTDFLNIH
ncbi:MAG: hypothetical protein ABJ370_03515 [Paracoccaceae bacterium]